MRVLLVLVQLACYTERCQRETVAHSVEVWFSLGAAADDVCLSGFSMTPSFLQVAFPAELDVYDFCTAELQQQLQPAREALRAYQDMLAQQKRTAKQLKTEDGPKPGPGAAEAAAAAGEAPAAAGGDVDMKDAEAGASSSGSVVGALTGEGFGSQEGALGPASGCRVRGSWHTIVHRSIVWHAWQVRLVDS